MIADKYSGNHTQCHPLALAAFERAVGEFAAHRAFVPDLKEALALEPGLPAAHAFSGLAGAMMGRSQGMASARASSAATHSALAAVDGGTPHERALAKALDAAAVGRLKQAAHILEQHLDTNPNDFLAIKLAHALRFMTGQPGDMLDTTANVLPSWSADMPGYGFVLGCRAFALEETGDLAAAERYGRMAVVREPDDVWGLHAVAHVLEMAGRTREGKSWLGASRLRWGACGAFGQHLQWHMALFHLSEGDRDGALALYDAGIQPVRDGDFRDVANAVSLLWRLEQEGVAVGTRWQALNEIASERRLDCTNAFASLHYLMALIAAGETAAAEECVEQMRRRSLGNVDDQSWILARIGVPLAEILASTSRRPAQQRHIVALARDLPGLGGSRAQQDVFLRTLMLMADDAGDARSLLALSAIRRAQRTEDRFQSSIAVRTAGRRKSVSTPANIELREAS